MTTVAVVDDHVLLGQMISRGLSDAGLAAHRIDVSEPVLDQLAALSPAVVVLDLQLGNDQPLGTDYIDAIHELGARVVMLTGVNNDVELAKCLAAGADGVIQKSESMDVVVEQVQQAIAGFDELLPGRSDRATYDQLLTSHQREHAAATEQFSALTKREEAVLTGLMQGESAAAIAESAYVSVETIRSQIKSLMRKLEVHTQLEAVAAAHEAGWQPAGPE